MRRDRSRILVTSALVVATLLVFGHACRNDFVNYDDGDYVYQNPHVRAGLTCEGLTWAFTTAHASNWHPLTWMSLQLDAQLFGPQAAWGFHLTNILLHAANAALVFLVLERLTGRLVRSAAVAALFALHPLHVESVAWVSERKDVLSTLFWLLTLWAYAGYAERPGLGRYLLVVLALALGLMAKPMLVTLPLVLLLLDYWPLGRMEMGQSQLPNGNGQLPFRKWPNAIRLVLEKLPLMALAAASCVVTVLAQEQGGAVKSLHMISLPNRLENAVVAYVGYLSKTFWPSGLAVFYPHPRDTLAAAQVVGSALLLAAITTGVLAAGRRWRYLPVGWFWYLGTLVPVIGLVQVGPQALADRYTYVPLIGLFIMGVWGLADLAAGGRASRTALALALGLAVVVLAALSWLQVAHWRDSFSLWTRAYQVTDRNHVAANNLGYWAIQQGNRAMDQRREREALAFFAQGKAYFKQVIAWEPDFWSGPYNLAMILVSEGKPEAAAELFCRAARAAAAEGEWEQAVRAAEEALQVVPEENTALRNQIAHDLCLFRNRRQP